jgi:hypothetical protein
MRVGAGAQSQHWPFASKYRCAYKSPHVGQSFCHGGPGRGRLIDFIDAPTMTGFLFLVTATTL